MKLDKTSKTMTNVFNSLATRYNLMNDLMTGFTHRRTRKLAIQLSGFKSNEKALDLATGTGDLAFLLFKEGRGTVIGIDIADRMLSIASTKKRNIDKNRNLSFNQADINNLPFNDEIFDICTISYGIRNVPDPLNTMKEVARVTKKGGRFIIIEATPPPNHFVKFLTIFHFRKLAPLLAKFFSHNARAYSYLAESISQFPLAPDFSKIIEKAGWRKVMWYALLFGTVTIFIAIK